jgi:hypothetical protein
MKRPILLRWAMLVEWLAEYGITKHRIMTMKATGKIREIRLPGQAASSRAYYNRLAIEQEILSEIENPIQAQ